MVKRRRSRKILALILAVPVFLVLTELILTLIPVSTFYENRFFLVNRALDYPDVFLKDHDLFWRLRPSQTITSRFFDGKTYRINEHGLRGSNIPAKSDKIRIVGLGNSCTFGWGINDEATYLAQLEGIINRDPGLPEMEVINAGIPGYSSFQGRRFYALESSDLKPDIVLIMFGWNDQWAAADDIQDKDRKFASQTVLDMQNCLSRLKLYGLLRRLLLSAGESSLADRLNRTNPAYRVALDDFQANLETIVRQCRAEGVTPIILSSPIPALDTYYPPGTASPMHRFHNFYNLQARTAARNTGSLFIDLAVIFDGYDDLFDNAANDPIHFNPRGHRVAAEAIFRHLFENSELLKR